MQLRSFVFDLQVADLKGLSSHVCIVVVVVIVLDSLPHILQPTYRLRVFLIICHKAQAL